MTKALIGLGSNLGNREQNLEYGILEIANIPQTKILKVSSIYETKPIGPEQGYFLNAVALIDTEIEPLLFLEALQRIETAAGRTREIKWGPRTLDLDIIDFENCKIASEVLTIPHRFASQRRFVLEPLFEIAPEWEIDGINIKELLAQVSDQELERWKG